MIHNFGETSVKLIDKVTTIENALKNIHYGNAMMVGGFGVSGNPLTLIDGLLNRQFWWISLKT